MMGSLSYVIIVKLRTKEIEALKNGIFNYLKLLIFKSDKYGRNILYIELMLSVKTGSSGRHG